VTDALTPDQVRSYLGDVDFPADKDTLVAAAERAGAPEQVVKAIRAIPPVDYGSKDEVVRSVPLDPAPGANTGEAERQTAPRGVSAASRDPQEDRVKGADRRTV
jgi:hypothetical protein